MAPPQSSGEGQDNEPTTGQLQANCSTESKGQSAAHKDLLGADSNTSAKKTKPPRPETIEACPRCGSNDTKFCYYNNYNVKQPRFFCKSCQRYWTSGGTLRNVPPGSGRRKSKSQAAKDAEKQVAFAEQIAKQTAVNAMLAANSSANLANPLSYLNPMLTDPMLAYNAAQQQLLGTAALSALKMPGVGMPSAWPSSGPIGPHPGLMGPSDPSMMPSMPALPSTSEANGAVQGGTAGSGQAGAVTGSAIADGAGTDGAGRAKRAKTDGASSSGGVGCVLANCGRQDAQGTSGAENTGTIADLPNNSVPGQSTNSQMGAFPNGTHPMMGGLGMSMGDSSMANGGMGMPGMGDPSNLMGMGAQQSAVVQQQQQQFMYQIMLQQQLLAQSQLAAAAGLGSANPYLSLAYNPYFANGLAGLGSAGYGAGQAPNPWASLPNPMMGGFPAGAGWPPTSAGMGMPGAAGGPTPGSAGGNTMPPCAEGPETVAAASGAGAGVVGMSGGLGDAANALLGMTGGSSLASGHSSATGQAMANMHPNPIPAAEGGDSH